MKKIVDVNEGLLSTIKMGDAEEMWYSSKDGLKVQGWMIKPANFDPSKKYPMVLWIHGGPWSMYSVAFNWAFQNFSAMGYVVLYSNPRGSTGYGQEFVNGIQYSYPGKDYDDLMAGVDAAIAKGYVDEKNLFVCGGSGGGLLTAWTVGQTSRFAAAVAMRPVIDWHSFVAVTDGPELVRSVHQIPLGRRRTVCSAVAAHICGKCENAHNGDDRRSRFKNSNWSNRGVLSCIEDAS